MSKTWAVSPLDDTRISEREHRPRSLGAKDAAGGRFERAAVSVREDAVFPNHVRHCANNPLRVGRWTLALWRWSDPLHGVRVAYTCNSIRCPSAECQRAAAHRDFAKLSEGIERAGADGWCYLVLTIDQNSTLGARSSGKPWRDEQEAFRELSRMSRNFLSRLRRHARANEWPEVVNWVATVEIQRNGWPHLNLMIQSEHLAKDLDSQAAGQSNPRALRGWLLDDALACDWGTVGVAERAKRTEALAGYLVKKAGEHDRRVGEIAKLTQAPTNARMKLRRIRASKGFLRPLPRTGQWTGIMLRRQRYRVATELDPWGRIVSAKEVLLPEPMMRPDQVRCAPELQPAYLAGAGEAIRLEREQCALEERGASPERLKVDVLPPVRAGGRRALRLAG
jgi:hypothetical protein